MRTTVDLDPNLLKRLRDEAHAQGIPFKELLNRVLRRGLEAPPREPTPYHCPTFEMGEPLRPLDKALVLADLLEEEEVSRKTSLRK